MWYPFFIVGGMAFWTLTFLWFFALMYCVEDELSGGALASIVIYVFLIHIFGNANIIEYITGNWYKFLWYLMAYLVIGISWSMLKLRFSIKAIGRKIEDIRKNNKNKNEVVIQRMIDTKLTHKERNRIEFDECKGAIIFWMSYWPASLVWTMIDDPFKRMIKWIYNEVLRGVFKKIHTRALGDVLKKNEDQ